MKQTVTTTVDVKSIISVSRGRSIISVSRGGVVLVVYY